MMIKAFTFFLTLLVTTTLNAISPIKPYGANEVLAFTRIAYVSVSPNGKQIAFITWNRDNTKQNQWRYSLNLKNDCLFPIP